MGRNVPNVLGSGRLPVPPAAAQVPENSVRAYRRAARIWPDLPDHGLTTLAAHIGHEFHHHNAQADAEAAGRVLLAMMKHVNAQTLSDLLRKTGMVLRRFCSQGKKKLELPIPF
jgi:DNA polymerase III epsilon subunit-like protein